MTFNTRVQKHSLGIADITQYNSISNGFAASNFMENQSLKESSMVSESRIDAIEENIKTAKTHERIAMRQLTEHQIPALANVVLSEGKTILFKEILFEMFHNALVIDDDFKVKHSDNLRGVVGNYVDKNGGFKFLTESYQKSKSPYLKNIITLCESTASHVSKRKMTEVKKGEVDLQSLKFALNKDEEEVFSKEKEKLNVEELGDLVKDKVLTVIRDEKARQQKEKELFEDLENQANEEGKPLQESLRIHTIEHYPVKESTLFNSLFHNSYKELMEAVAAIHAKTSDDKDIDVYDELDTRIDTDIDDIKEDEFIVTDKDNIKRDEYQDDEQDDDDDDDEGFDRGGLNVDMDLILAETVTQYTLLEVAHTIKLETFTPDMIRKISQKIMN